MAFVNNFNSPRTVSKEAFRDAVADMWNKFEAWEKVKLSAMCANDNWKDPKVQEQVKAFENKYEGKNHQISSTQNAQNDDNLSDFERERHKSWQFIEEYEKNMKECDRPILEAMIDNHFAKFNPKVLEFRIQEREKARKNA